MALPFPSTGASPADWGRYYKSVQADTTAAPPQSIDQVPLANQNQSSVGSAGAGGAPPISSEPAMSQAPAPNQPMNSEAQPVQNSSQMDQPPPAPASMSGMKVMPGGSFNPGDFKVPDAAPAPVEQSQVPTGSNTVGLPNAGPMQRPNVPVRQQNQAPQEDFPLSLPKDVSNPFTGSFKGNPKLGVSVDAASNFTTPLQAAQANLNQSTINDEKKIVGEEKKLDVAMATNNADVYQKTLADVTQMRGKQQSDKDARDAHLEELNNQYEAGLKEQLDSKVDPDHFWADKSTADRIFIGIAGMAASLGTDSHGNKMPNGIVNAVQKAIDRDIDAQKENIANKRAALQDFGGYLKQRREQFKDKDVANAAAQADAWNFATRQVEAFGAKQGISRTNQKYNEVLTGLETKSKQAQLDFLNLGAQNKAAMDKAAAASAGAGMADMKKKLAEIDKRANALEDDSIQKGGTFNKQAYKAQQYIELGLIKGSDGKSMMPSASPQSYEGFGKDKTKKEGSEGEQEQLRSYDNALDNLSKIEQMMKDGGSVSASRTAQGKALVAGAYNALARAETGGKRAPSPDEIELLNKQIPSDPNQFNWTDAGRTQIATTIQQVKAAKARLQAQLGQGGVPAPPINKLALPK